MDNKNDSLYELHLIVLPANQEQESLPYNFH